MVMLTSGTTGTPKGAPRQEVGTLVTLGALLDRIPFRTDQVTYIAPPFFHALGFANLSLAMGLGCRVVTRRRFAADDFLASARTRASYRGNRRSGDAPAHPGAWPGANQRR